MKMNFKIYLKKSNSLNQIEINVISEANNFLKNVKIFQLMIVKKEFFI